MTRVGLGLGLKQLLALSAANIAQSILGPSPLWANILKTNTRLLNVKTKST